MKIYQKLLIGLLAILSLVAVSSSMIYRKISPLHTYLDKLEKLNTDVRDDLDQSLSLVDTLQSLIDIQISLGRDVNLQTLKAPEFQKIIAQWIQIRDQLLGNIQALEYLKKNAQSHQTNVEHIDPEFDSKLNTIRDQVVKINTILISLPDRSNQLDPKALDHEIKQLNLQMNMLGFQLADAQALVKVKEGSHAQQFRIISLSLEESVKNLPEILVAHLLVFLILYFFVGYRLLNTISKPIARLQRATQAISEGDLEMIVEVDSKDEVGHLSMTFNTMVVRLRTIYDDLQNNIRRLQTSELELMRSKELAEEANRAKSAFLANMSHELRTPLNAIIGYSEMLQEEAEDLGEETFSSDLKKINRAAKHLLGLINDILDISKIESGRMELHLETIDIYKMVQDVDQTIRPLITKNKNQLQINCSPDIGEMITDLTKLRQNLFNILSNAAKFTENGLISLTVLRREEWIYFQIKDTGIGMNDDQLARIFQPFTQADESTTRKYGGTGLGLTITQRFCQMMGGEISVESTEGTGSIFMMKFPLEIASKLPTISDQVLLIPPAYPSLSLGTKVLIIDDDAAARQYIGGTLKSWGFEVYQASNGADGLALAKSIKPDAITLDVMMPGMDGWAVLTEMKADSDLANIPVIMTTLLNDQNLGYALGASDYIVKPIDREQLLTTLQRLQIQAGHSILVVEDDPMNREVLHRQLVREGYVVQEAMNGRQALTLLEYKIYPKIILLDLMMPEMDGFEFVDRFRNNPEWNSIPIVVLTSKDLTYGERQRLQGSVENIYRKGNYDRKQFMEEIHRVLTNLVTS